MTVPMFFSYWVSEAGTSNVMKGMGPLQAARGSIFFLKLQSHKLSVSI
jgi:hypothetical protein